MRATGQKVAVKVQHEQVDELMSQDLINIEVITSWVAYFEPEFDFKPVIEEWAKVAMKEVPDSCYFCFCFSRLIFPLIFLPRPGKPVLTALCCRCALCCWGRMSA